MIETQEVWRDVKGYNGDYQVSNYGRVYSVKSGIFLSQKVKTVDGYLTVKLYGNGKSKREYVHRLVAIAFVDNPDNLPQVNHKDENPENNYASNLEWCSSKYNNNYGQHGERIAQSRAKPVRCIETGEEFQSAKEAAEKYCISASQIYAIFRGRCKTAGGYHWERI